MASEDMENAGEKKQQCSKAYSLYDVQAQVEMRLFRDRLRLVDDFVDSHEPRKDPLDEETETIQQLRFYLPYDCQVELEMLPKEKRYLEAKRMILSTNIAPGRMPSLKDAKLIDNARMHDLKRSQRHLYHSCIKEKFTDWIAMAKDPSHWITWRKLPSMFRFAMRRVAMPQKRYWDRLRSYGFDPAFGDLENEEKGRLARERSILLGAEHNGERHVSLEYKGYIPKGLAFLEQQDTKTKYKRGLRGAGYSHEGLEIINLLTQAVRDFRNQQISRQGFYDIINDQMDGLSIDHAKLSKMLDNDTYSPEWIGETLWEDAVEDTPLQNDGPGDNVTRDRVGKPSSNLIIDQKVPPTLKLKFSIRSRFQAIHADVMTSVLPLEDAPSKFREVLGMPDISDRELSRRLHENSIPADCYFGVEVTAPEPKIPANIVEMVENLATSLFPAPGANNTFSDPSNFTPDNSRRESLASDCFASEFDNHPSRSNNFATRPATPPPESLIHNPTDTQKLNNIGLDKTEVSNDVEVIHIGAGDKSPHMTNEEGSEEGNDEEWRQEVIKYEAMVNKTAIDETMSDVAMKYEETIGEVINSSNQLMSTPSHQQRQIDVDTAKAEVSAGFISKDNQGLAAIAMPPPQQRDRGLSPRPHAPKKQLVPQSPATSDHPLSVGSPVPPSPNRPPDWASSMRGTAGRPFDDDYQSENLSVSPEQGNTNDLWGITMPTREARQLGAKIGLPGDFVNKRIRSVTPRRADERKFKKETLNTTIPHRKRKGSPSSANGHLRVRQKLNDGLSPFAKESEDHRAFLHRSIHDTNFGRLLKSIKPKVVKKSKKRCEECNNTKCVCIRDFSLESFRATPIELDQDTRLTSRAFGSDSEALQELDRLASKAMKDNITHTQNEVSSEARDIDNDTLITSPASSSQHLDNTRAHGQPEPFNLPEDDLSIKSENTICAPQSPTQDMMNVDPVQPDRAERMSVSSAFRGLNVVESNGWSCLQAPPPTPRPTYQPIPRNSSERIAAAPQPSMTSDLKALGFTEADGLSGAFGDFPLYSSAPCEDDNSNSVINPPLRDSAIEESTPGTIRDRVLKKYERFLRKAKRARRTQSSQSSENAIREITGQDGINNDILITPAILDASRKRRISANSPHQYSYFHSQNTSSGKSGSSSASNLNKQFDKYRGTSKTLASLR